MHPVLYLNHNAFQANQGPSRYPNLPPGMKIDVRFSPAKGDGSLKTFDLLLGHNRRNIIKGNQRHYARKSQDMQAIVESDANKNVRREQRQKNFSRALFPSTLHLVQGEKSRYASLSAVFSDAFFMAGASVHCIPTF